jgi:hypothetical protein
MAGKSKARVSIEQGGQDGYHKDDMFTCLCTLAFLIEWIKHTKMKELLVTSFSSSL